MGGGGGGGAGGVVGGGGGGRGGAGGGWGGVGGWGGAGWCVGCVWGYQGAAGVENGLDGGAASSREAATGGVDPLLLLPAVTEPHPDHLLFHVQLVRDHGDLLRGRFLVLLEEDKKTRDSLLGRGVLRH